MSHGLYRKVEQKHFHAREITLLYRLEGCIVNIQKTTGSLLKLHFQIPCVFPVYSLSDRKFALCEFM